jgi:hypothetical protein
VRELEATAGKFTHRRDGLREFGLVFSAAADKRGGASWASPGYHLKTALAHVDDRFVERIEGAKAPFWRIVREAVLEERARART